MKQQKSIFLKSEGNKWYSRNKKKLFEKDKIQNDHIIKLIHSSNIGLKNILEVGCCNGYRLDYLQNIFNSKCFGIDPSRAAIEDGKLKYPNLNLSISTADQLKFSNNKFDLIIFRFCLYLCDRSDLFKIIYESDRVLKDKGHIIIYDFYSLKSYKKKYIQKKNIYSYKMDYKKLFLSHPYYKIILDKKYIYNKNYFDRKDNTLSLSLLRKDIKNAYRTKK